MAFLKMIGPFFGGILFALGLSYSGMADPKKIKGFLDVFGEWNSALVFVLGGAVMTNVVFYQLIAKRMKKPFFDNSFFLPMSNVIDKKLILGAAIFGIGWGISGLCPGPGMVNLVAGTPKSMIFLASLFVGIGTTRILGKYKII